MTQIEQPFEELIIPRRDMFNSAETRYRVYFDARNFKLVEAVSALDALRNSGINKAYKIERHNPMGDNVIQFSQQPIVNSIINSVVSESKIIQKEECEEEHKEDHEYVEIEPTESTSYQFEENTFSTPQIEAEQTPAAVQSTPADNAGLSNEEVERLLNGQ